MNIRFARSYIRTAGSYHNSYLTSLPIYEFKHCYDFSNALVVGAKVPVF